MDLEEGLEEVSVDGLGDIGGVPAGNLILIPQVSLMWVHMIK